VILILSFFLQFLKVATNETSTLHLTIYTWIWLEIYNNNDQQFNVANFKSGTFYLKVKIATFKGVQLHIGHPFKLNTGYLYQ